MSSERSTAVPVSAEPAMPEATERRQRSDRRTEPGPDRRGMAREGWVRWARVAARDAGMIVVTVGAIVFSVRNSHPIFAGRPTVAQAVTKALPVARAALPVPPTPKDTS